MAVRIRKSARQNSIWGVFIVLCIGLYMMVIESQRTRYPELRGMAKITDRIYRLALLPGSADGSESYYHAHMKAAPRVSRTTVALCTIVLGREQMAKYNQHFRHSHEAYVRRHGYDLIVVEQPLDPAILKLDRPSELFSFQKLLAFSQPWSWLYDTIVVLDSDILLKCDAPSVTLTSSHGVGMVDEYSQPDFERHSEILKKQGWESSATEYYALAGFRLNTTRVLNTGVIVANPSRDGSMLRSIYERYHQLSVGHPRGCHFEQSAVGYELQTTNTYQILPNSFNAIWVLHSLAGMDYDSYFRQHYFLHFAGGHGSPEINHQIC